MQKRLLGDTTVSAIGLGCMGMSQAYGVQDEKDSVEALHRAVELGTTFFAKRMPSTLYLHCKVNIRYGRAMLKLTVCWKPANSWGSLLFLSARWAGAS